MPADDDSEYASARPSKFRVKSKKRHRSDDRHHRSHKRHRSEDVRDRSPASRRHKAWDNVYDDPSTNEHSYEPNDASFQHEDPNASFREALFDALADDEGASYWEGVYGQPIHVYERPPQSQGPVGELEQMSDEQYADYVRGKMWEKTHQHAVDEWEKIKVRRQRRREEKEKEFREAMEAQRRQREHEKLQDMVEESLRTGERRRKDKRWKNAWDDYTRRWQEMASRAAKTDAENDNNARHIIPWPVVTGRMKDVSKEDVEAFFDHNPEDTTLSSILKAERVRWHPDKMQQRFSGTKLDSETLKSVTAVFQVVDRMWSDMRDKRR